MIYGYARVSTTGQTLDAQHDQLRRAGAKKIFAETASGANAKRTQLRKAITTLQRGDVLIVTRLDRLARSTRDLLNIAHQIDSQGARLKSLSDTWADSTTPHGRLMMTVLAGLAEFERSLISARSAEGRKRARDNGVKFGPKPKLNYYQRTEAIRRKKANEPLGAIARTYGVSKSTISRLGD